MPRLAGVKEREHRPFFGCHVCDKDMHKPCPRCKVWFCKKHLKDHDCVEVLLALLEKTRGWLEEIEDEYYELIEGESDEC